MDEGVHHEGPGPSARSMMRRTWDSWRISPKVRSRHWVVNWLIAARTAAAAVSPVPSEIRKSSGLSLAPAFGSATTRS